MVLFLPELMKKIDQTKDLARTSSQSPFRPATDVRGGTQTLSGQFDDASPTRSGSALVHSKSIRLAHGRLHGGLNE